MRAAASRPLAESSFDPLSAQRFWLPRNQPMHAGVSDQGQRILVGGAHS